MKLLKLFKRKFIVNTYTKRNTDLRKLQTELKRLSGQDHAPR